jgi:hypothetical protein
MKTKTRWKKYWIERILPKWKKKKINLQTITQWKEKKMKNEKQKMKTQIKMRSCTITATTQSYYTIKLLPATPNLYYHNHNNNNNNNPSFKPLTTIKFIGFSVLKLQLFSWKIQLTWERESV